jgi:hypothetical protein
MISNHFLAKFNISVSHKAQVSAFQNVVFHQNSKAALIHSAQTPVSFHKPSAATAPAPFSANLVHLAQSLTVFAAILRGSVTSATFVKALAVLSSLFNFDNLAAPLDNCENISRASSG